MIVHFTYKLYIGYNPFTPYPSCCPNPNLCPSAKSVSESESMSEVLESGVGVRVSVRLSSFVRVSVLLLESESDSCLRLVSTQLWPGVHMDGFCANSLYFVATFLTFLKKFSLFRIWYFISGSSIETEKFINDYVLRLLFW